MNKNIIICLLSFSFAQVINYNLDLIHHITIDNDLNNFGVSDVWGYTDLEDNEYAVVGYRYGTLIYNVTNPEINPEIVADIIGPSSGDYYYHRDYKTFENHLYIVNEMYGGETGMQVVDLNPLPDNSPIQLDTYNNIGQSHNLWIDSSGFAFIEHYGGDNIHIANLSNPSYPTYESSFGDMASNCHDIYTRGNIAYVSEGWSYQFGIYDISNLNNIIQLATIPCEGYAHNAWTNNSGDILVTTEETDNKTIKIWDISDYNNINLISEYLGENNLAHNVHIKDNFLYLSHYTTGIKIVDIFNPEKPTEVAAYDTYPLNDNGGYYGCWGAYPFTANNYVYASDMQNGLYVLNFESVPAGWVEGTIFFNQNIPLENANIRSLLNNKIFYTDSNGEFSIGFPSGIHDFIVNDIDTININFMPHETIEENFIIGSTLLLGDLNQDYNLDILDIIITINIILDSYSPSSEEIWAADINEDGNINIQDIILLIQLILNH